MKSRNRSILEVAIVGGLAQIAAGIAMYLAGVYFAQWSMAVSLAVLLIAIVVGTNRVRAMWGPSAFRYRDALLVGVAISVTTGVLYALYNVVSINFFYTHFLDDLARAQIAMKGGRKMPVGSVAQERAALSAGALAIANLVRLSVAGSVISAINAIFLRRPLADNRRG